MRIASKDLLLASESKIANINRVMISLLLDNFILYREITRVRKMR